MQYSAQSDDFSIENRGNFNRTNIFSVSERDTANTIDDKYCNTSINFNKIKEDKKRKVLESFKLVNFNKGKGNSHHITHTLNSSIRQSPRFSKISNYDRPITNFQLPASHKGAKDFILTKFGKFRRPANLKNSKKLRLLQRRTATNSPNYDNVSLNSCLNSQKNNKNAMFIEPNNFSMTMYGKVMNLPSKHVQMPGTSVQSQR